MKARLATSSDIEGILALQKLNLYSEMTKTQRTKGFVTTPFIIPQIEKIMEEDGLFVVEKNGQIIAYAFAGTWKYFAQWAIFPFMAARLPDLSFNDGEITTVNSFQYGPVCIDVQYRGKKILNTIFEAMRLQFMERFPVSITFINKVNAISFRARQKLGWEVVDEFDFNGNRYLGLAFDMKKSVL
ncbi:MAG: hypothetical protein ACPGVB_15810 [Chitinophagales bacterium]